MPTSFAHVVLESGRCLLIFTLVVLLITCTVVCHFSPSHTPHPSIYLCYARSLYTRPCCHLIPGILNPHALTSFYRRTSPHNRRSFPFSFIFCSLNCEFCSLFRLHVYVYLNPSHLRLKCTPLLAGFFSSILYLPSLLSSLCAPAMRS
jgi:hypothetical protein